MKLTDKQIAAVRVELEGHSVPPQALEDLTTFNDFNYWWDKMFGYRNLLSKFLIDLKEKENDNT